MNIPVFQNVLFVQADGYLTASMQIYFDDLIQTLNEGLADSGWEAPINTTAQIAAAEPNKPIGTFWFNSNLAKLQVKTAPGVIETIQSV
jgi:hypothetical protein